MTTAYYSAVLDHPMETVWSLIRDFNNYPAYIDGVTESIIEDDKRGDEVGAVRRFCYLGNWVRQRLADHSDAARSLTYASIEPLPFPSVDGPEAVSPAGYEGTMHLMRIVEGNRTFIEWSVALDTAPEDTDRWHALFQSWIPQWTHSLARALARRATTAR
jgi:Polyketide cyclase / dehydrase and lipid transport